MCRTKLCFVFADLSQPYNRILTEYVTKLTYFFQIVTFLPDIGLNKPVQTLVNGSNHMTDLFQI